LIDIEIKTIPMKQQRYPTVGDYWDRGKKWIFRISRMKDWRYELLVAVHELVEKSLVKQRGIAVAAIDDFDKRFERERELGMHTDDEEPGFDPYSPYLREHAFAMKVERMLAKELGVDWDDYAKTVEEL
jgi:hypothetical protein